MNHATSQERFRLLFLTFVIGLVVFALGASSNVLIAAALNPTQAAATTASRPAASGEKVTIEGVIAKREGDVITLRNAQGADTLVRLSSATQFKEKKSNFFRSGRNYAASQLVRGLNIEVKGRKAGPELTAEEIKIKDADIRVASTVETRVTPVEEKLAAAETRISQSEKNAQQLSGQISEVSTLTSAARAAAKAAQDTADSAGSAAKDAATASAAGLERTNTRISGLDDYDVKSKTSVTFPAGSAVLSKEAKADLDKIAGEAKNEKAYVIEVTGFASSDGAEEANRRLSQRRAEAVIQYLAENHEIPLRRLVTPMGVGDKRPVADNATHEGRVQNRRVEVSVLVNKVLGK